MSQRHTAVLHIVNAERRNRQRGKRLRIMMRKVQGTFLWERP